MSTEFAGLWFWEFTDDPYGYIVAPSSVAAIRLRRELLDGWSRPEIPRRMERAEVEASRMCTPYSTFGADYDEWTTGRWLLEIDAADKRAEVARRQLEGQRSLFG